MLSLHYTILWRPCTFLHYMLAFDFGHFCQFSFSKSSAKKWRYYIYAGINCHPSCFCGFLAVKLLIRTVWSLISLALFKLPLLEYWRKQFLINKKLHDYQIHTYIAWNPPMHRSTYIRRLIRFLKQVLHIDAHKNTQVTNSR